MCDEPDPPRRVLLVGSVPLADAESVFRAASEILGAHLRRIPDGETGERTNWVAWQRPLLLQNPAFEPAGPGEPGRPQPLHMRAGVRAEEIEIGPLGYAAHARRSFEVFSRLKREGVVPARVRFQVSLPSPLAPLRGFAPDEMAVVAPRYEARLLAELDEIAAAIPHAELAIQWDVAVELAMLEGVWASPFGAPAESFAPIAELLVRLGERVPAQVELGYHLCYGDVAHRHFVEPRDTALMAQLAAAFVPKLSRAPSWLHLPVPRSRDDEAYLAPLRALQLPDETELYLGLVHLGDGVEGARRRIATARRVLGREFGIATECGLGRRPAETVPELLRLHATLGA